MLAYWLARLSDREFAVTTMGPKFAKLRLMEGLLQKAVGQVYPLTRDGIRAGAACLLSGNYRSAAGYLSELKQEHIRKDCVWNDTLQLAIREAVRGCTRGMGPPDRAPEVRVSLVAITPDPEFVGVTTGGPRRPRRAWVVAMFWLLREIELASLTLHPSSVRCWKQRGRRRATLFLPITKKDQMGKGAARTWSCLCGGDPVPDGDVDLELANMCPVCTVWEQAAEVEHVTGVSRDSPEAKQVPLFPTHDGRMPDKRNVVAAWAELFGESALDWNPAEQDGQLGAPEFVGVDGHSPRRSGAKFLIRIGWFREGVAYLGRWGSDAILFYIEEVTLVNEIFGLEGRGKDGEAIGAEPPLEVLSAECEDEDDNSPDDLRAEAAAVNAEVSRLESLMTALEARVDGQSSELLDAQRKLADLPEMDSRGAARRERDALIPNYVWAVGRDEPYHAVASAHPMMSPEHHITRCTWAFGLVPGLRRAATPPEAVEPCKTCWPELRKPRSSKRGRGGIAPSAGGE